MQTRLPAVFTLEDAASYLLVTPDKLRAELEAGRLRGVRIGDEWRTTEDALLRFVGELPDSASTETTRTHGSNESRQGRARMGLSVELSPVQWEEAPQFSYTWPDKSVEKFKTAYRSQVAIEHRQVPVLIGFTTRASAGRADRPRAVVFFGQYPKIEPVVEFSGAHDFEQSGRMASVIKLPRKEGKGQQHLRPGADVPAEYAEMPLDLYSDVVRGPYAARSVAVVADKGDLTLMARHALIRARWKNWL